MQNVLLVVWDACRLDRAKEHAGFLNELRQDNLWFENAVAPSRWSLPSHVSMFTGDYPSQHGHCTPYSTVRDLSLLSHLTEREYHCIGVSANAFVSGAYGFDDLFDEFHYTLSGKGFDDGADVSKLLEAGQSRCGKEGDSGSTSTSFGRRHGTTSHSGPLRTLVLVVLRSSSQASISAGTTRSSAQPYSGTIPSETPNTSLMLWNRLVTMIPHCSCLQTTWTPTVPTGRRQVSSSRFLRKQLDMIA